MAVRFQYDKISLQQQQKQLKIRERTLPMIRSKESALRLEVKKARRKIDILNERLEQSIRDYQDMVTLWDRSDLTLVSVTDVQLLTRKTAGVVVPVLDSVDYEVKPFSLFSRPSWFARGVELLKTLATLGIETEFLNLKLECLEYARRKTTQKVNLFEKIQIPDYKDVILKIERYLEDKESLSKVSQKIMRTNLETRAVKQKERLAQ